MPLSVTVEITGGPSTAEVKPIAKHKKNAELGDKQTVYSSSILIEQADAITFEDNEEVSPGPSAFYPELAV